MKKLNRLNKFLAIVTIALAVLLIRKIVIYKPWERYYYTTSVSAPLREFPVVVIDISFISPGNWDDVSGFTFGSWGYDIHNWGDCASNGGGVPHLLPKSLILEYVDFRAEKYYKDTIPLPKEKMVEIFKEAKKNHHSTDIDWGEHKMGLEFNVGIANDGNIIFWLVGNRLYEDGNRYKKEFYRIQLQPKPFPEKIVVAGLGTIYNPKDSIKKLFIGFPDSVLTRLRKTKTNA